MKIGLLVGLLTLFDVIINKSTDGYLKISRIAQFLLTIVRFVSAQTTIKGTAICSSTVYHV